MQDEIDMGSRQAMNPSAFAQRSPNHDILLRSQE